MQTAMQELLKRLEQADWFAAAGRGRFPCGWEGTPTRDRMIVC
jgi:hypothetical protein